MVFREKRVFYFSVERFVCFCIRVLIRRFFRVGDSVRLSFFFRFLLLFFFRVRFCFWWRLVLLVLEFVEFCVLRG